MMRPVALIEFQGPSAKTALTPALSKPPTLRRLEATLYNDGVARYEAAAKKAARSLGGEDFELTAQWKRTEIRRESNAKAKSLMRSYETERERIAAKHPTNKRDREKAWRKFTARKQAEYADLANADAHFNAENDVLVHSGAVDVDKAKVKTWVIGGTNSNQGVGETVWRYEHLAKGEPEEQGECQLRATSDGSKAYVIWHSLIPGPPEDPVTRYYPWKPSESTENDLWFRRLIFWPDELTTPAP